MLAALGQPDGSEPSGWDVEPLDARWLDDLWALWEEKAEALTRTRAPDPDEWED